MSGGVNRDLPTERQPYLPRPDLVETAHMREQGPVPPPRPVSAGALPAQIGPYKLGTKLGEGGMGVVYEATDTALDRTVALKVLRPTLLDDEVSRNRFLREAKAAAAVKHDNVVTIFQVGEADGVPYLAMERLRGSTLDRYLAKQKPLSWAQ